MQVRPTAHHDGRLEVKRRPAQQGALLSGCEKSYLSHVAERSLDTR